MKIAFVMEQQLEHLVPGSTTDLIFLISCQAEAGSIFKGMRDAVSGPFLLAQFFLQQASSWFFLPNSIESDNRFSRRYAECVHSSQSAHRVVSLRLGCRACASDSQEKSNLPAPRDDTLVHFQVSA